MSLEPKIEPREIPESLRGLIPEEQDKVVSFFEKLMMEIIKKKYFTDLITKEHARKNTIAETADEIARTTGDEREEVILKALTLYELAIDAVNEGKRLVLLTQDYRFSREITGLVEPKVKASASEHSSA